MFINIHVITILMCSHVKKKKKNACILNYSCQWATWAISDIKLSCQLPQCNTSPLQRKERWRNRGFLLHYTRHLTVRREGVKIKLLRLVSTGGVVKVSVRWDVRQEEHLHEKAQSAKGLQLFIACYPLFDCPLFFPHHLPTVFLWK